MADAVGHYGHREKKPFQNRTKIVDFEPQKLYYVISKPALLGKITYV